MTPRPLPEFPNLEQLKKQAKSLLRDAHAGDADARARIAALPAFANTPPDRLQLEQIALHDAQSVIAREHGFASWNALREEVEARTLSFTDAVDAFVRAASDGAPDRARRLLSLYPTIANATLQAELLLADAAAVAKRLHANPQLATTPGLAVMLERGFDPNVPDHDGVTALHRAAMGGHPEATATLLRFGARMDALDGMFSATPLVWAAEGRSSNHHAGSDHVGVALVLIDAGSPLDWNPPPAAPGPERTLDALRQLRADAMARR